jgi:hypothetical protein
MDLQSSGPWGRRCGVRRRWAILAHGPGAWGLALLRAARPALRALRPALPGLAAVCLAAAPVRAVDNTGLGPLSVRNQFPVALAFLSYTPENPRPLPAGAVQFRYQFTLTNSFVNTQSPASLNTPQITAADVAAGLTAANFPATGYGVYLDAETQRHLLRLQYGLSDSLELGLELAWVRFGGGFLDSRIQGVEGFFGGLNEDRTFAVEDRFDFYVAQDGALLRASSQPASGVFQDPVLNLKWNWSEGGEVLPAFTVKLSYKHALESAPSGARALVASGGSDTGTYILLSKAVGSVVGHFQWGHTRLEVPPNPLSGVPTFAKLLRHRVFGLEFRLDGERSVVVQSATQSSIFQRSGGPGAIDFDISGFTDVLVMGYQSHAGGTLLEYGLIEDYNQLRNEADITFYFEVGWRW